MGLKTTTPVQGEQIGAWQRWGLEDGWNAERGSKCTNFHFKTHKSWACHVQHAVIVNHAVYLKVAKRVDLKSSHHRKKNLVTLVMDVN